MKKLLNSLYINQQKTYLHKQRETIVVKLEDKKLGQFPIHNIGNIACFGNVTVSPFLMGFCAENNVNLTFYTEYGRYLCQVTGKPVGNVLLRREQFRWADSAEKSADITRLIIAAKVANSRAVLQRELRNHGDNPDISAVIKQLAATIRRCKVSNDVDQLRGLEGEAAANYFGVFNDLIRVKGFEFSGRVRRPPTDHVNALLSFAYSLITQECVSALTGVGLDPYVGFLHKDRPGRPSLALDLLEEFRSYWAERFVLTLINRKQFQENDFIVESTGAVRLTDTARKQFLTAHQERKQQEIQHPYLLEKIPIGLLPHCQAMLLARHVRGDTQHYTPFLVK
ncbi:type I-C CRISPR-associated endonuclease Cas1c [Leucothrix pacifica]|uniref:CRISPR-associated endonuclease Cas1 n=1 Tax=Leucothrix pacifica TaxID=1247513 RepID=A0A317C5Y4_9GAMM|nr:type I-C CRISPR-associated endonuclease Cas1c [Leucothrix pacifica]PWQ94028.1 subtype I-C CRISPR-associated endonuclease Cas1 [Leucothrix pacifica]